MIGDAHTVHIVGEGPVVDLPWLALPGEGRAYLAEEPRTIHVLTAERDLLRRRVEPRTGSGLLAVGDPDFAAPDASPIPPEILAEPIALRTRPWPCSGTKPVALPPLPAARAEVEELARSWPADAGDVRLLVGADASETDFKRMAPGRAVLHLATHGVVFAADCADSTSGELIGAEGSATRGVGGITPLAPAAATGRTADKRKVPPAAPPPLRIRPWLGRDVWLALAGASRPLAEAHDENEGLLTAEEVITLDLRGADWVVLSACQSGVGPAWAREGVLGMRRAFHLAGARTVIASHWPVADRSTQEWMLALYTARARGMQAGDAVAEASRRVLAARRADGRSTHPFYWAAFSATGE
jgi:CHAT domain-containing protein